MGSAQSFIPAAAVLVAGAAVFGYAQLKKPVAVSHGSSSSASTSSKKQKPKKKPAAKEQESEKASAAPAEPNVVSFPPVVPGGFDVPTPTLSEPAERLKPKKKKKAKKAGAAADAQSESSATAPESSVVAAAGRGKGRRAAPLDNDGWTKVETKKVRAQTSKAGGSGAEGAPQLEVSTSDAGITTSVTGTGNSSPVTERTEEESQLADAPENRRTLAEKLLPKPRKTGVEEYVPPRFRSHVGRG